MKKYAFILSALLAATTQAQTEVSQYVPGVTAEGITYFLPRTALHVTVKARRTVYTPGEYARYAERYLRLTNVGQTPSETWTLLSVDVTPYGVADTQQAYTIKLKQKTSAPLVTLAPDGRLLAVNASGATDNVQLSQPSVVKDAVKTLSASDYKTEEILSAGSEMKMAELTANEIYDIRENRSLLTKGQADFMPSDGEQLRLMLEKLDQQEEALLQLFKGTEVSETHTFTLTYIPTPTKTDDVLFRFSKHYGLVPSDDVSGEPYTITLKDLKTLPAEAVTTDQKNKKPVEDLRYIVPSRVLVKIAGAQRELFSASFPMAQYGRVEHLGGELFNKKIVTHVLLVPETGGIAKIESSEQ